MKCLKFTRERGNDWRCKNSYNYFRFKCDWFKQFLILSRPSEKNFTPSASACAISDQSTMANDQPRTQGFLHRQEALGTTLGEGE